MMFCSNTMYEEFFEAIPDFIGANEKFADTH